MLPRRRTKAKRPSYTELWADKHIINETTCYRGAVGFFFARLNIKCDRITQYIYANVFFVRLLCKRKTYQVRMHVGSSRYTQIKKISFGLYFYLMAKCIQICFCLNISTYISEPLLFERCFLFNFKFIKDKTY